MCCRAGRAVLFHNCEEDGAVGGKEDDSDEATMADDDDKHDEYADIDSQRQGEGGAGCTRPHKATRHAGLPVEKGEKWAVNLWVREFETKRSGAVYRSQLQNAS